MPQEITCPGCRSRLLLPPERPATGFTCPRCLAPVPDPDAIATAASIPPSPPSVGGIIRRVDVDVSRDARRTSGCLVILVALGALGIAYAFVAAGLDAVENIGVVAIALLFLGLITTGVVVLRRGPQSAAEGFRRIMVGTLAAVGVLVLVLLALAVLLLLVCQGSGGPGLRGLR